MVGVTGLEPVTLRLSSACSNQLSYTPTLWAGLPSRSSERRQLAQFPARLRFAPARQLRSERRLVELRGFEPLTYSLQSCRSTN